MKNDYVVNGEITTIFLKRNDGTVLKTIIDTTDFERANEFPGSWYANYSKQLNSFYVYGNSKNTEGKRIKVTLHRWLTRADDLMVDHKNFNTLDNRRSSNLRLVTHAQNSQNRNGARRNSYSGIRGVTWDKQKKLWCTEIRLNGKKIRCGRFKDIKKAEEAVKKARMKYMPYSQEGSAG